MARDPAQNAALAVAAATVLVVSTSLCRAGLHANAGMIEQPLKVPGTEPAQPTARELSIVTSGVDVTIVNERAKPWSPSSRGPAMDEAPLLVLPDAKIGVPRPDSYPSGIHELMYQATYEKAHAAARSRRAASHVTAKEAAVPAGTPLRAAPPAILAGTATPPLYHPPLRTSTTPQVKHYGVSCDGCECKPILGTRFKMLGEDYNLCTACHEKLQQGEGKAQNKFVAVLKFANDKHMDLDGEVRSQVYPPASWSAAPHSQDASAKQDAI